ncbi:MAG TPA: 50S ribosomal protein L4 [Candidatus Omnitrophota bacterium]|nr:50S ribosomal protein L4 [Candidatus Omnitrophota bacterium]
MSQLPVLDKSGKEVEKIDLPEQVFGPHVNSDVIHQAVIMYQACLRQGTASTKERGAVSESGKKPYRQKGTGRARAGSTRAPNYVGGGVVFGPHPRDYRYAIPQKMRLCALKESLNAKYKADDLLCVTELTDSFTKTKDFAKILKVWVDRGKVLALLDGSHESVRLVSRNIPRFQVVRAEDVNAYDVMKNKKLLLTKTALEKILKRLGTK